MDTHPPMEMIHSSVIREIPNKWYYFNWEYVCKNKYIWNISIDYYGWYIITPLFGIIRGQRHFARHLNGLHLGFWPNKNRSDGDYLYSYVVKFYSVNNKSAMRPWNSTKRCFEESSNSKDDFFKFFNRRDSHLM